MAFLGCWLSGWSPSVSWQQGTVGSAHTLSRRRRAFPPGVRVWALKWVAQAGFTRRINLGGDLLPVAVFIRNASGKESGGCLRGLLGGLCGVSA